MDSDEASDADQPLEDLYSEDDAVDAEHEYFGDNSDDSNDLKQQNFFVLSEADIRQRQEDDITTISSVLSISRSDSATLLGHYNWSVSKVNEEWFADEDRVRKAVGLFSNPKPLLEAVELTCGICFDTFQKDEIFDANCGHPFCGSCWEGYISNSINDGPGCLTLRCPDPSCSAAVGRDMIDQLVVSEDDRKKYGQYLVRSYVEDNRKTKWCPAPGCVYAVDFVVGSGRNCDVICSCSYGFCWNCTEEAHRPVDCGTVAKWIVKNSSESENTNWILANSKPCPECKRPIEKNHGCMHMTCTAPCKFQFCWLCLGAWSEHRGSYACNKYKKEGKDTDDEKRRKMAKKYLRRYTHYYERWAANEKSRQKAVADLEEMRNVQLEKLSEIQCESEAQLKFLVEAWSQIVECRRVLKWTYAYGYYLPEKESAKTQLFEYLQGEAEAGLERLHQCAENELEGFLNSAKGPSDEFNQFRTKLAGLTSVTKNYFENLVRALENGLSELDSQVKGSKRKPKGGGGGGKVGQKRKRKAPNSKTSTSRAANEIIIVDDDDDDDVDDDDLD